MFKTGGSTKKYQVVSINTVSSENEQQKNLLKLVFEESPTQLCVFFFFNFHNY